MVSLKIKMDEPVGSHVLRGRTKTGNGIFPRKYGYFFRVGTQTTLALIYISRVMAHRFFRRKN